MPDDPSLDPRAYQKIVGATFANAEHRALVTIGKHTWSKWDLGRIGCPHPSAAVRVQRLMQQLDIRTEKQFLQHAHAFGRYRTLGVASYWTVLALARDLGADIEAVHGDEGSFHAIHARALKADTGRRRGRGRRTPGAK